MAVGLFSRTTGSPLSRKIDYVHFCLLDMAKRCSERTSIVSCNTSSNGCSSLFRYLHLIRVFLSTYASWKARKVDVRMPASVTRHIVYTFHPEPLFPLHNTFDSRRCIQRPYLPRCKRIVFLLAIEIPKALDALSREKLPLSLLFLTSCHVPSSRAEYTVFSGASVYVCTRSGSPTFIRVSLLTPSPSGSYGGSSLSGKEGSRHDQYGGPRTSQRGGLKRSEKRKDVGERAVGYTVDI